MLYEGIKCCICNSNWGTEYNTLIVPLCPRCRMWVARINGYVGREFFPREVAGYTNAINDFFKNPLKLLCVNLEQQI